jgi:two-component system, LytTR family, sensor kinase
VSARRWFALGAAAWSGVVVLFLVVHGFRRLVGGLPFYPSWQAAASTALQILFGAVLSPLVVVAFRRLRVAARPLRRALILYGGIGVTYWLVWAGTVTVFSAATRGAGAPMPLVTMFLRSLGLSALIALTLYTVIALVYQSVWHLEEARGREVEAARLTADLALAETAALRARMNPGFIRDTLTLAADLMVEDARAARTILSNLSELLRVSLGRDTRQLIALGDEVRLAERFVRIQKARYGEKIRVKLSVDEDVITRAVSPLVLQPLLREAFLWVAMCPDDASITLSATDRAERIRLLLVAECSRPASREVPGSGSGITTELETIHARLAGTYGPEITIDRFSGGPGRIELTFFLA